MKLGALQDVRELDVGVGPYLPITRFCTETGDGIRRLLDAIEQQI